MLGLNISADGAVTVEQLRSVLPHGGWVRLVLTGWHDLREYARALQLADFRVLGVVASESFHSLGIPIDNPQAAAEYYAARYDGVVSCVQVGNEFDHVSESSETLPVPVLNQRLAAFAAEFSVSPLILGGAVSGNPAALRGIKLNLCEAVAVHPYGQRAEPDWPHAGWGFGYYGNLLNTYAAELASIGHRDMPIWVTEVGLSTREVQESFRAEYLSRFCRSWEATRKTPLILFCGHDYAGFGIIGTPSGKAVRKVAEAAASPTPPAPPAQAQFVLGFKKFHDALPAIVGEPKTRPEFNTGFPGWQVQTTTRGILSWHQGEGMIFVSNDERVWRWPDGGPGPVEVAA